MADKNLPDDGRPCNTDVFIACLLDQANSFEAIVSRLQAWSEGDWESALEGLDVDYD